MLNHGFFAPVLPANLSWEIPGWIRHTSTALSESMGVLISENVLAEPGAFFIACVAKNTAGMPTSNRRILFFGNMVVNMKI